MPITTTPSGGPQGEFSTYTPISTTTLSSNSSSLTVTNLPTTYTDLVLIISARNSTYTSSSGELLFNGDSGSSYAYQELSGNGTATNGSHTSSATSLQCFRTDVSVNGMSIVHVLNYSNTTTFKTTLSRRATADATGSFTGLWKSISPITSITFKAEGGTTFTSGSTFTIYGIKAAATAPKATGGDVITTDGTYWYHAFKTTGLFDVKQAITCDILQIAGGGSGSYSYSMGAGGGGAGGVVYYTSQSLSLSTQVVTVGAGGAPRFTYSQGNGFQGNNSQFGSLTASVGGGYGAGAGNNGTAVQGGSGGSGGGSAHWGYSGTLAGGTATSGQGSAGGSISGNGANRQGAGGGGAGGVGQSTTTSNGGGNGGAGTNTYSSWATVTGTGVSGFYAGGGGGAGNESANNTGTGGSGGGGAAARDNAGVAGSGTANTGSGGGGAFGADNTPTSSGAGGSGLVIVRYPV